MTVILSNLQGRLSRQGLLSLAGEWETPGVVARTVSDAALLLAIIQGKVIPHAGFVI